MAVKRHRTVIIEADSVKQISPDSDPKTEGPKAVDLVRHYAFMGDGTDGVITLEEDYIPGTTRFIVNGREWIPKLDNITTYYEYEETQNDDGYWTKITPRYAVQTAPCMVTYVPSRYR